MRQAVPLSDSPLRRWIVTPGWPRHLLALGGLWGAIFLLFLRDVADMAIIWWTSSSYGHCLFIPVLIGWLVHQRRAMVSRIAPVCWTPGLLWLAGGALCWLLGDAASLGVIRHGAIILMMQGAVAALLGPAVVRALLFPLFYAFFMIPVGSELEPALQLITARIAVELLHLFAVPAHIEGIFITTPTGYFKVAEACSGAKFLIAMTAYGVLVCNVCFRSWIRRGLFLAGALLACLLANGVRAFGTIYVAHLTTVDAAVGFDHVVYGWVFFAVVMAGVMAAAWPFFDRKPGEQAEPLPISQAVPQAVPQTPSGGRGASLPLVLGGALALVMIAPVWGRLSAHWGKADLAAPVLPQPAGWERVDTPARYPWKPRFDGADHLAQARYADGKGHVVDLAIATFGSQDEDGELIGFGQGAVDPDGQWAWSSPAWAPDGALGEEITAPGPVLRHVVSFYRVGEGALTGKAMTIKIDTMKARLLGRDQRAVAILLSAEEGGQAAADASIRAFLAALGDPRRLADAATGPTGQGRGDSGE
ncbi:MAG: exosortase A [Sphingobium sp.]